jgi:hypothetical protein
MTTSGSGAFYLNATGGSPITSVNIPAGQSNATFYYYDTKAAPPTVTATDSSLGPAQNQQETVNPAPINDFMVSSTFTSSDVAGTPGSVTVTAMDGFGNTDSSGPNQYESTAILSSTDNQLAGLPPSYTFVAGNAGSKTFNNVILATAGSQTITATDSVNTMIGGTTPAVTVMPAPPNAVKIVTRPPGGVVTAGVAFSLTVDAKDPYQNTTPSYQGAVTIGLGPGSVGTLTGTVMMMTTGGMAQFNDLMATTSGPISLTATSGGLNPDVTSIITVVPGAATHFMVATTFPNPDVAGTAGSVTITALDSNNNPVTSGPNLYVGNIDLSSTDTRVANLPASIAVTAGDAGTVTIPNVMLVTAGTRTISANDLVNSTIAGSSAGVDVVPAAADHLAVTSTFANPDIAGTVGTVAVMAEDQYNNVAASGQNQYVGTVHLASSDGQAAGVPASYTIMPTDAGAHTFTGVALRSPPASQTPTSPAPPARSQSRRSTRITTLCPAARSSTKARST